MTDKKFHFNNKIGNVLYGITADNADELQNAYEDMMYFLKVNGFVTEDGKPAAPAQTAPQPAQAQTTSNGETQSIPVEEIIYSYTSDNGDHCWKIKGGWAKEWGISVWYDVFEKASIDWTKLPLEKGKVYKPNGEWIAKYIEWEGKDKQGNPQTRRKVVKLQPADEVDEVVEEVVDDFTFDIDPDEIPF